jgi:hypothetical protein
MEVQRSGALRVTSQSCGCNNKGTQTRTVTCNTTTGIWNEPEDWGDCTIGESCGCNENDRPKESILKCGCGKNKGTMNSTISCDETTGKWTRKWSKCLDDKGKVPLMDGCTYGFEGCDESCKCIDGYILNESYYTCERDTSFRRVFISTLTQYLTPMVRLIFARKEYNH